MKYIFSILFTILTLFAFSQRIGVVFSGGGATGFAHIGVLKALEENNIPINFISGTSAGALIGALYASGYSPAEIEEFALSEKFYLMSNGGLEDEFKYSIHQQNEDAELFSVRLSKDSILKKSLPTSLLNPTFLDFETMNLLGTYNLRSSPSFDSLFIPFRCVASDIVTKESVLFREGSLNLAVRASMTYPFFITPIKIDGRLLFDGGLYNNFPANDLYNEFDPDYIIGSNVSYNEEAPAEDDLMSQIKNMFSSHSNYFLPCDDGIIIEPNLGNIGTFDFDKIELAIKIGYDATIEMMDSIKIHVSARVSKNELKKARELYENKKTKLAVNSINVIGVGENEMNYLERKLVNYKKNETLNYEELKKRYLRLYQSEHILSMFPTIKMNGDSTQELTIDFRKKKPFKAAFGGHFSSRPVNTGFLSLSYSDFKVTPLTVFANTYFGKFYGSVKAGIKFYLPTKTTSYIEPIFVMNRWDYFKSFSTFFEDVKPSYLVQNETYWSFKYHIPTSSKSKVTIDFTNGTNEDQYYQSDVFTKSDTADVTKFLFYSPAVEFSINKFNRKQFESAGSKLVVKARFVHGIENTIPGSTALDKIEIKEFKNWFAISAKYQNFVVSHGFYRLGISLDGHFSNQSFFSNYTASILAANAYQPTPDSKTGFYNDFRSNKYFGGGLMHVFTLKDKLDLRIETYMFQPIARINNNNGVAIEGNLFEDRFGIASASLIYNSPIGPIRGTVNYFDSKTLLNPLSFQLSLGFIIFNENSLKF